MSAPNVRVPRLAPLSALLLICPLLGLGSLAVPAHAQAPQPGPGAQTAHAPSSPPRESADAAPVPKEAKAAFRAFATADTPKALSNTITRGTAFEFGALLFLDTIALSRGIQRTFGGLVESEAQTQIGTGIQKIMKKYKPEGKPESREERFQKMRENGHSFFLDMVRISNTAAEQLGTTPHVDMTTFLGDIPDETHWTFETGSDSEVNVVLTGDRVDIGEHSFLMSGPPHVVKKNGEWKVRITGVSRFSLFPSSGTRLHLREPLSISKRQFDSYFEASASLPLTPPMSTTPPGPTARSGPVTLTLSELDVSYEDGRRVPSVDLRVFLPPFPHLGIPETSFRKYNGELTVDQVTDTEGNTYSSGFWDKEVAFTLDSRFATPHGMGPAMETEYNQELNEEGLTPAALSTISGSVTLFFPMNAETSTVPVSELGRQTALSAGDVTVKIEKQSDQKFTVVWPREKRNLFLRLYGRTDGGEVLPLELGSSDFADGTFTSTVTTKSPVQSIGLCAGRSMYEKTVPFELDLTIQRASIPLFQSGATTSLGGTSFEVVNSAYDEKESQTRIFLRQDGPLSEGMLAGLYYGGVEDPDFGSRSITVGYTRFLRYEKKPKRLLLYLAK